MTITLKVEPDVLISKSGELANEKATVMNQMEQAKSEINSLTGVWKSEAADTYQTRFRQVYTDIDNMLATVQEYVTNLNEAAGLYKNAEAQAKNTAEGLPAQGVFN